MLSESAYWLAMSVYLLSALLALGLFGFWLRRRIGAGWIFALVLLGGALLLTPAYPEAGIETMAPALIVAAFQWLTIDQAAAEHALRPLIFTSGAALGLALLLAIGRWWRAAARGDKGEPG